MAKKKSLTWERVGQRGMAVEPYRIAKVTLGDLTKYVLHHEWTRLGTYESFEIAKQAAQDHSER